jgi:hypothetical protein
VAGFFRSVWRGAAPVLVALSLTLSQAPEAAVSADPVIVAAGDIGCDPGDPAFRHGRGTMRPGPGRCHQQYTSNVVARLSPTHVLMLGDAQYSDGRYHKFVGSPDGSIEASYGSEAGWGRWLAITHPVAGNHDYGLHRLRYDPRAAGYFSYFSRALAAHAPTGPDPRRGYYSFDVPVGGDGHGGSASWHLIALNSMCAALLAEVTGWKGGCARGSPQFRWLRRDLAANKSDCTLVYWHHALFTSGAQKPRLGAMRPVWRLLHRHRADVVLNANSHHYERFAPQTPSARRSRSGIREWIVGTGGASLGRLARRPARNSRVRNNRSYGVLKLALHGPSPGHRNGSYSWRFHADGRSGDFGDSGSADCVGRRSHRGRR